MSPVTLGPSPASPGGELELGGRGWGEDARGQQPGVREAVRGQLVTRLTRSGSGLSGLGDLRLLSHNVLVKRIEILSLEKVKCQTLDIEN